MATKETPSIPQHVVDYAEKLDSKHAKELTVFIMEMEEKDTGELRNILKAIGQTIQRKQPKIAQYNWELGNVMSEKAVIAAGIDVDNNEDIRTKERFNQKGEPVTVYYNGNGLKHLKTNFLQRRIENATKEISEATQDFIDFMPKFSAVRQEWEAVKDISDKPANFVDIATRFMEAEKKFNALRQKSGFSTETLASVEKYAEMEHKAMVLDVQSKLDNAKSHVQLNTAKRTALNSVINAKESARLTKEVQAADARQAVKITA